jgi:RimJ/RimL family protein N-acetyltransferase
MNLRDGAPLVAAPLGSVTTSRLDLRAFAPSDLDELADVFSHREVWEFPFGRAFTSEETRAFLDAQLDEWRECGFGCWVARTLVDGRLIGYLGLSVPTFLPEVLPRSRSAGAWLRRHGERGMRQRARPLRSARRSTPWA